MLPSFLLNSAYLHNPHPHPQRAQSHFPYLVWPVTGCWGDIYQSLAPTSLRKQTSWLSSQGMEMANQGTRAQFPPFPTVSSGLSSYHLPVLALGLESSLEQQGKGSTRVYSLVWVTVHRVCVCVRACGHVYVCGAERAVVNITWEPHGDSVPILYPSLDNLIFTLFQFVGFHLPSEN